MSKPSILAIMPTRDRPRVEAWNALGRAATKYGCPVAIQPGQPRDFNRNRCVAFFLEQERNYEALLFVDDDSPVPVDAIERLVAVDKPVVTAIQPLWLLGALVANVKLPDGPNGESAPWPDWITWQRPTQPFRVGFCGFGCVLIRREVLETLKQPYFVETHGDVWGNGNQTEDIYFNLRCREAGIETWCDPQVEVGHLKSVDLREWLPRKQINLTVTRPTTAGE